MDASTSETFTEQATAQDFCTTKFRLCQLKERQTDRYGHIVEEIFWIAPTYAVYRSEKGVCIQFSDDTQEEDHQRDRITEISPELCELRYLTYEMRSRWHFGFSLKWLFRWRSKFDPSSLYEHNMAQAIMLVMQNKIAQGQVLARHALKMAETRVTNDNAAMYFLWCLVCWIAFILAASFAIWDYLPGRPPGWQYIFAAMSGATGAMLSVATRLREFELHPCQQSDMNYLMASARIGIGVVAGPILLLFGLTLLKEPMRVLITPGEWHGVAVLGFIGGFTERLVPVLLSRTTGEIEAQAGTPVQAVRDEETSLNSSLNAAKQHPLLGGSLQSEGKALPA
ncbi:MAG TPA: hypothetical protein VMM15_33160 [Bradyrhizobium sp.]|nr:hypothetical protein [Bradyrhizobium sp.]